MNSVYTGWHSGAVVNTDTYRYRVLQRQCCRKSHVICCVIDPSCRERRRQSECGSAQLHSLQCSKAWCWQWVSVQRAAAAWSTKRSVLVLVSCVLEEKNLQTPVSMLCHEQERNQCGKTFDKYQKQGHARPHWVHAWPVSVCTWIKSYFCRILTFWPKRKILKTYRCQIGCRLLWHSNF